MVMLGMASYWVYHNIYGWEIFRINVDKQMVSTPHMDDLRGVNLTDNYIPIGVWRHSRLQTWSAPALIWSMRIHAPTQSPP